MNGAIEVKDRGLSPCKTCGEDVYVKLERDNGRWRVHCWKCGMRTDTYYIPANAISAWERRPD